jgi:putative transposase
MIILLSSLSSKLSSTQSAYPQAFTDIASARKWFADFVNAYNKHHQHSGLNYMTPFQVRSGKYRQIAQHRNQVMKQAFERNPQRWSRNVKQIPEEHIVLLNPTADTRLSVQKRGVKAA